MYSSVWVFLFCKPLLLWKNTWFLWVEKNIKHVEINVQWRHDFTGVTVMLCLSQSAPVWTQYSQLAGWHRPLSVDEGSTLKLGGVSVCVRTWMCVCVCRTDWNTPLPGLTHPYIKDDWFLSGLRILMCNSHQSPIKQLHAHSQRAPPIRSIAPGFSTVSLEPPPPT